MSFEEYYKSLGFTKYPFGVFTSEGEKNELHSLFHKPENYSVIVEGIRSTSAIVIGERGSGKTALSLSIEAELNNEDSLFVRIEEYSSLGSNYTDEELYKFLTERIAAAFFIKASEKPNSLWKYSKDERLDLSMYLHSYVSATSKEQLRDRINKIQNSPIKRHAINAYNFGRVFINYGLKATTKFLSDALTKHFSSLPEFDTGNTEYLRRIESHIDESFTHEKKEFFYLNRLCELIKRHSFSNIYVAIDKIDEDQRFGNDAEDIAHFILGIASTNQVLTNPNFHILLFLWSTPFNQIRNNVRTQKLTLQKLDWGRQQLERAVCKRMAAYSDGKATELSHIIGECSQDSIDLIFTMCNENPRDLWHILNYCFKEQFSINSSEKLSTAAIEAGIQKYVIEFNYYEYYPKKSKARTTSMDVYSYIKHLLKLDSPQFTKDKLNTMAGIGSSINNYVVAMENMGLVKKISAKAQGGAIIYEIRDPKISYAMRNNIEITI